MQETQRPETSPGDTMRLAYAAFTELCRSELAEAFEPVHDQQYVKLLIKSSGNYIGIMIKEAD
ncbi:MAG: hypothetical protein CVV44_07870 [Spirochaetae bacterium HGW-Spirochaetae-1]|jgi:hypothetical protein|nr:MAG: hypothetical protein CVV44_07870 [Spirochaetae bacterium HGW-Spirochaetae-1]